MKKCFALIVIFSSLYSADIRSLPSSITLTAGQQRQDTAISQRGNGQASSFHSASSPARLTLSGAGSYVLSIQDNTTTFYANSFNVGANSQFALMGFHTMAFNGGLTLAQNATFSNIASGNTIDAQGSEYGGESKVVFSNRSAQITLGANSTATFSNGFIFASSAKITLGANSALNIDATKSIRFQNEFTNNGGTATLTGNVYNIGDNIAGLRTSTATFTHNSGTITINGNFYNGGQADNAVDSTGSVAGGFNTFDPAFGGGGNLIINGATMTITGSLISKKGGNATRDGDILDPQNSSIKIYGGTLIVGGGLYNQEGSTLIFGVGDNGKMGELQGNLTNDKGAVGVDIEKITLGQSYKIINGTISGLGNDDIQIINPNSQFFSSIFDNTNGTLTIKQATNANGETKFDEYKKSLNTNSQGILNALSSKFGGDDTLLTSGVNLENAITTTEKVLKESYIAQPQNMISALQASALPMPVPKSVAVARRTAASELIRFDNGKRVSPFERKIVRVPKRRSVYFTPLGAILRADNLKGYIAGFTLGTSYEQRNFTSQIYLAYAYGASLQDFTTQSADTTGNLFQAGFLNRYSYSVFEMSMNANLLAGVFKIKNEWQEQSEVLNSTANFGDYQLNLGLIVGAKLGKRLSFKPFVGIQNYVEMREKFKQNGGLGIESKGYNAYIIDGVLGVEGRYVFNEFASVFGKFSFEERLYNTHKEIFMWAFNNELKYDNASYDNALSLNLGTQIYTWYDFNLDAELLYKHYNNGLNYFGGNLILKYAF